jgi:argininosuccinate synthase
MAKAVLAFSGGLGTMAALHLLKQKKGLEVVTFTANLGQKGSSTEQAAEKALQLGADSAHVGDLRERFVESFCWPALRAGAIYESGYALATALARPLIVAELVKLAREEGAEFLAHGCAAKSNDQVRFEASAAALAPELTVLAPLREYGLLRLDEVRRYCEQNSFVKDDAGSRFSIAENVFGSSIEWARAPEPYEALPETVYRLTVPVEKTPEQPKDIVISFERGVPVALDTEKLSGPDLLERVGTIAGQHGVGRLSTLEDRLIGIKMCEVYEQPAATVVHAAKRALERLVLSREIVLFKNRLSEKYAELVYNGLWYSELREALDAFFEKSSEYVQGDVRVQLGKGQARVTGVRSKYSLYSRGLAAPSSDEDEFAHDAVRGFMDTISLTLKHQADHWRKEVD